MNRPAEPVSIRKSNQNLIGESRQPCGNSRDSEPIDAGPEYGSWDQAEENDDQSRASGPQQNGSDRVTSRAVKDEPPAYENGAPRQPMIRVSGTSLSPRANRSF